MYKRLTVFKYASLSSIEKKLKEYENALRQKKEVEEEVARLGKELLKPLINKSK